MLLLLLDEVNLLVSKFLLKEDEVSKRVNTLFSETTHFRLDDLFEIKYGLLEQRYKNEIADRAGHNNPREVVFLRTNMIREEDNTIKSPSEIHEMVELYMKKKKDAPEKELLAVPARHLLERTDFLIKTKGEPKLIDLSKNAWDNKMNLVATHHFIALRPKWHLLETLGIETGYLKEALRLIVDVGLCSEYNQLLTESKQLINETRASNSKRSATSVLPALSLDKLKNTSIAVPKNKSGQEDFVKNVEGLVSLKQKVDAIVNVWHDAFLKKNINEK